MKLSILAYHKIQNGFEFGINKVSLASFEKQIKYLREQDYRAISLAELSKKKNHQTLSKTIVITFDDADESIFFNAYPILNKYGFAATIFVISDFVGLNNFWDHNLLGNKSKHLNWDQLKILCDDGWEIGSHTASHRDLTKLTEKDIEIELKKSKLTLSSRLNIPVNYISFPFNRYSERIILKTSDAGYLGACTMARKASFVRTFNQFLYSRLGVYSIDTLKSFQHKLKDHQVETAKQRVISFFSKGSLLYRRIIKQKKC